MERPVWRLSAWSLSASSCLIPSVYFLSGAAAFARASWTRVGMVDFRRNSLTAELRKVYGGGLSEAGWTLGT